MARNRVEMLDMRVRDWMTSQVFSVKEDHRLLIVEEVMNWAKCRHVPVVDEAGSLVGLITHRDLLRVAVSTLVDSCPEVEQREHLKRLDVREVMNTDIRVIDPDATVQAAARLMRRGKYGCLPVVDQHNKLLGIITENDLLRIVEALDEAPRPVSS